MKKTINLQVFEMLSRAALQDIHGGGVQRDMDFCFYLCELSPDGGVVCGPPGRCSCDSGWCSVG
ncbi:hypothetical protein KTO58_13150 [Chitinophaga pendula]|uniref:hypothetical protein n=1 Tax=Chitinophaga TaxID=79328 RepID=UPI0012FDA592|nr:MULTISPECIES: hypothetical protein [Chitinophaga]UCJ10100.1 hypothetical protein KTO58_13150 [Chitinophaga pendula]